MAVREKDKADKATPDVEGLDDYGDVQVGDVGGVGEAQVGEANVGEAEGGLLPVPERPKRRSGPRQNFTDYPMSAVDQLPPDMEVRGRTNYADLFTQVPKDGKWYIVAHFKSPGSAKSAEDELREGGRNVPDITSWELTSRRQLVEGKKHSFLYAKWTGEVVQPTAAAQPTA